MESSAPLFIKDLKEAYHVSLFSSTEEAGVEDRGGPLSDPTTVAVVLNLQWVNECMCFTHYNAHQGCGALVAVAIADQLGDGDRSESRLRLGATKMIVSKEMKFTFNGVPVPGWQSPRGRRRQR